MRERLAKDESGGEVAICGSCDDAHLRWGRLALSIPREEFLRLAEMLGRAAAELERRQAGSLKPAWGAAGTVQ